MPFTFVYRSPYENQTGRYIRRFPKHTILQWFQEHWFTHPDTDSKELLGSSVYGFENLFEEITLSEIPVPKDHNELGKILKEHIYAEGSVAFTPEVLEVFTDDDALDVRYWFIEDSFAERHPEKTAFLLHEGSLPTDVNTSETAPCTYLYAHGPVESADSQEWDCVQCPGSRLGDHPRAVIEAYEALGGAEAGEFFDALLEQKSGTMTWPEILEARTKLVPTGNTKRKANASVLQCSEHICQLDHHAKTWKLRRITKLFFQTILFDDIWAASHPMLARSIEHYACDRSIIE